MVRSWSSVCIGEAASSGENPLNVPIVLEEEQELVIFGVVTYVINEAK
jgi:hypothetical protein